MMIQLLLIILLLEDIMEELWGVSIIEPHPVVVPILLQLVPLLLVEDSSSSSSSSHLKPPMGHFDSIVYSILLPIIPTTIITRVELNVIYINIMHLLPHLL